MDSGGLHSIMDEPGPPSRRRSKQRQLVVQVSDDEDQDVSDKDDYFCDINEVHMLLPFFSSGGRLSTRDYADPFRKTEKTARHSGRNRQEKRPRVYYFL